MEYNQLDPLLRSSDSPQFKDGDVNDKTTGYSPFPGNINQLLFRLEGYVTALDHSKGLMPEFVNPKYKDAAKKTVFKKPTRLECMMQDFPTVLTGKDSQKVGFTSIQADLCFSPVKNATADGVALQAAGVQPATAATGEADQYGAFRKILSSIGCQVMMEAPKQTFAGIEVTLGPAIVLKPSVAVSPYECKQHFPSPSDVKISSRSTLIVKGSGVVIESLDLDGALVIDCADGEQVVIKDKVVKNQGWVFVPDETSNDEVIKMRGYHVERKETERIGRGGDKKGCIIM